MPGAENLLKSPVWFLDMIDLERRQAVFYRVTREHIEETPFLDERFDRAGLERATAPLDEVAQANVPAPSRPACFIWHSAFCGSTLLARLLSAEGKSLCVREPSVLNVLASLKRHGHRQMFDALKAPALRSLANQGGDNITIIKPTNVVNTLLEDVDAALPDARHLFLTSSIDAFIASLLKKKEAGRAFARKLFSMFAKDGASLGKIPADQLFSLTDLQIAALVWHMQIETMRKAQAKFRGRAAWLDGDVFLASPENALSAISDHFCLDLSVENIASVVDGPLMKRDAKDVSQSHGAERRRKETDAIKEMIGDDLQTVIDWSFHVSPDTPRNQYLGRSILSEKA